MSDFLNKETIKFLIALPLSIGIVFWLLNVLIKPSPENIEKGTELIVQSQIPWWIDVIQWLTNIPGELGVIFIIIFIFFLKWLGEIR